jgi:hypothetical protein
MFPARVTSKAVGESKDRDDDRVRGLALDESFFPESSSFLELDEVFQIAQKLELDLAE